jgi:L-alanine-DL-glutamate epimerase-like enolase superfamily enzyme
MKITGWATRTARVPYDEGRYGNHVILQLRTDEGLEGIGYVSRIAPASIKPFVTILDGFVEQIIGQEPLDIEALAAKFRRRGGALPGTGGYESRAASAIDVALWDIKGKALGVPVYKLLGGSRDRVPCYASWRVEPGRDLETLARNSAAHVENGFQAMKAHLGALSREKAVEHLRVMRETVGDDIDLLVDITQHWNVKQAISMSRSLEPLNPYWIEDPVPHEDYDGLRQVTEAIDTRVCAGEAYRSIHAFKELLSRYSVDIAMIDLDVGLTQGVKVAHLAEAYGVPLVSHLATEIMAHLIAAAPTGLTVEYIPWAEPLFQEVPRVEDGDLVLLDKPGLGLEISEEGLSRFPLEL